MALDDPFGNGQTKPGALAELLGGIKWIEDLGQFFFPNSRAIVFDLKGKSMAIFVLIGLDCQISSGLFHGLRGVDDQIKQDLLNSSRIQLGLDFLRNVD